IESAQDSIVIASAVMDSRPITEALIARKKANPALKIQIYVDMKSYISEFGHQKQLKEYNNCLKLVSENKKKPGDCNKGFSFGYQLQNNDIEVMYKTYAYRWDV